MNEHSSRSHAIFTITIECSEKGVDGNQHVRMGKLHLVDLAVCKTLATSLQKREVIITVTFQRLESTCTYFSLSVVRRKPTMLV